MTEPIHDLKVYEVPVDALNEYPGNPRRGDINAIAESLNVNGQYRPIIVRRETREILAGNHTWKAARKLQWETIKVQYVEGITDDQAKKIVLADNKYSDMAKYNIPDLTALLESLEEHTGTGYSDIDLAKLLRDENQDSYTDQDDTPNVDDTPRICKTGEVWILGEHKLLVGDATKTADYKKLLGDEQVELTVTDPPYNVDYRGGTEDKLTIMNDKMSDQHFRAFLLDSFAGMLEYSKPGAPIYVFHGDGSGNAFRSTYTQAGWELKQVLIWAKNKFTISRQDYQWQHEPIIYGWKPGAAHVWTGGYTDTTMILDETPDPEHMTKEQLVKFMKEGLAMSTVLKYDRPHRNGEHPTMKPVGLLEKLILNSSVKKGIVLDPFVGSGSTLIAAHRTGRRARVMEIDPKYADVVCRRFQEHTHIIPVNEATGEQVDFTDGEQSEAA